MSEKKKESFFLLKLYFQSRDGNCGPIREYLAWPNPNGSDFTRPDKE